MNFVMYKDKAGQFRWRFKAANGKIIAASSESYLKKADCQHGIDLVKGSASAPVHDETGS